MSASTPTAPRRTPASAAVADPPGPPPVRAAGWTSIAQGLLLFVPLGVLGAAIDWPASLDRPAAEILPSIAQHEGAVRVGYLAYLVYSVLFGVTLVLLARLVEGRLPAGARRLLVGLAIASVIARSIGIVRWLAPMPVLADAWGTAGDEAERRSIAHVYDAVNAWGGTIGEALGVGLFAAGALGILAAGLLRERRVPRWLAVWSAVAAAAVLLNTAELAGGDLGPVLTVSVTVVQLWFLAAGAWLLTRGRRLTS